MTDNAPAPRMRLQPGDIADGLRVEHPTWGPGRIVGTQGRHGGPVLVAFDRPPFGTPTNYVNHATDLYPLV